MPLKRVSGGHQELQRVHLAQRLDGPHRRIRRVPVEQDVLRHLVLAVGLGVFNVFVQILKL